MEKIYQVYDSIFKRMFTLSNKAVINAINGLFGTSHSPDSKIDYMNRESIRKDLKYRFADIFITINDEYRYHLEAQMYHDSSIVVRVFEYGLYHALETRDDNYTLHFPEPVIIYFGNVGEIPKETSILVDFGNQGSFTYTVKNFAYQDHSIQELNNRKLILFIPFQVLRMRDILMPDGDPKDPSKKEIEELKRILESDILESIEANYKAGNITVDDYHQLCELTNKLYIQVLLNYEEKGGDTTVKELLPGAIELPNDVYRIRIDELEEQNGILTEQNGALTEQNGALTEQNGALTEQNGALTERNGVLEEQNGALTEQNGVLTEQNGTLTEQNSALKEQNSELQGQKSALEDELADLRRRLHEAEKRKKQ